MPVQVSSIMLVFLLLTFKIVDFWQIRSRYYVQWTLQNQNIYLIFWPILLHAVLLLLGVSDFYFPRAVVLFVHITMKSFLVDLRSLDYWGCCLLGLLQPVSNILLFPYQSTLAASGQARFCRYQLHRLKHACMLVSCVCILLSVLFIFCLGLYRWRTSMNKKRM